MQNIVTLIVNTSKQILDERIINKAFMAIEKKGGAVSNLSWLAKDEACDIFFDDIKPQEAYDIIRQKLDGIEVDIVVQENNMRKKKMLISDMDSTIIQQECIDEIADKLNLKNKVAAITERAMNGELDFSQSLRERVGLLGGLDANKLDDVYKNNIEIMPGAETLVRTMKKHGAYCLLVSGGFTFFTDKIAGRLGFDENRANILEINDGKLTGKVVEPILDKDSKLEALEEVASKLSIRKSDAIAVGDGANDLPMLKNAGVGVAYYAKESVQEQVACRINYSDLTALLYIQGYKKEEFVKG